MKKLLFFLVLIFTSFVVFSQSFVKINNQTNEGLLVTVDGKTQYLLANGVSKRSFIVHDENVELIIFSESVGKTLKTFLPVENGEINITKNLLFSDKKDAKNSTSMNFVKKNNSTKVLSRKNTGRFVKIFNLTSYTMYGMTRELKGLIFYPGGVEEDDSGSKSYIASKDVGIKYKPFEDYFLDKNDVQISDSLLLYRVLNSSFSSAMHLVWLPFENINFNLRYQSNASIGKNKEKKAIDLLAVVQRRVTENTSIIIITDDDLKRYSPKGEPIRRRIQNETNKKFILDLDGKKITCSPKVGRKISLSEDFYLPDGAYYLPMSIIYQGQMHEFYFLTIFDSRMDKYPKINSWDVSNLEMFNQKPLN